MLRLQRTRSVPLFAFLLLTLAMVSITPAIASTDLTLEDDHSGTIFIRQDGSTLDCNGHTIVNDGGSNYGILLDGVNGVSVRNCTITGFPAAVSVENSHSNTIKNSTLIDNDTGVVLLFANHNTIRDLHIVGTGQPGTFGVLALSSHENTVSGTEAAGHADQQFHFDGSDGNTIKGNTATGGEGGFAILAGNDNTLSNNIAIDYSAGGFSVTEESNNNRLTDNRASTPGLNGDGFALTQATGNVLRGNRAHGGGVGYRLQSGAVANDLRDNVSVNPRAVGFYNITDDTDDSDRSDGNTFRNNTVIGGFFGFLLRDVSGADLRDNTVTDSLGFGFFLDAGSTSDNTIIGNTATDVGGTSYEDRTSGSGTAGTANEYRNNTCSGPGTASNPIGLC